MNGTPTSAAYSAEDDRLFRWNVTRIAVGPHQGRKVFTLQTLPGCDEPFEGGIGKVAGFSLHAGVAARADQRHKLERLCRYISRPAISEKRLSLTPNGNVRYLLKTPCRDGTTHVRDLRLRWACEEAGFDYSVQTVPFEGRETNHLDTQPFGQVPMLSVGELQMFESGAGLLHLAKKSEKLMPRDPVGEVQSLEWTIAALNSIEMVTVPWWFLEVTGAKDNHLTGWMESRLNHMERVLRGREWLAADRFTVADLLMADVLRVAKVREFGSRPATESYVTRITQRPAFQKAYTDQMAHFARRD